MQIKGDYVQATFMNEFGGSVVQEDFEFSLREVKESYSEDNEFKKDVQIIIDENYLNNILIGASNM